jgi:hypothetical protein
MQLAASASKICIRVSNFCFRVAIWCYLIQSSRVCTRLATSTICMPLAATQVQFACDWRPLGYNLYAKARCPNSYLKKKIEYTLNNLRIFLTLY